MAAGGQRSGLVRPPLRFASRAAPRRAVSSRTDKSIACSLPAARRGELDRIGSIRPGLAWPGVRG